MKRFHLAAAALASLPAFAACAQAESSPVAAHGAVDCAGLKTLAAAPDAIGLPTRGMHVTDARDVAAVGPIPAYCLVTAEIAPVDRQAPPIRFQVALPAAWNHKALGVGGGGFNGSIPPIAPMYAEPPNAPPAIARGYAVFAGDSGHSGDPSTGGAFMTDEEALRNYLGDAIKKTRDAAMAVIRAAYRAPPERAYFIGGSTGGREALWAAGRWPKDWNGVIAMYPARDLSTQVLGAMTLNRTFAAPGGFVPPAKRALLLGAAMEACDTLDGAKDGVISDVQACNARFVPARASYQSKPLRCPDGKDEPDCLSDTQLKALAVLQSPIRMPVRLASGMTEFPGFDAYTSDLGTKVDASPIDQALLFFGLGIIPPGFPYKPGMSLHVAYGDAFARYGWVRDASVNPLTLDDARLHTYAPRISALSKVDSADADLSAFAAKGGKVLIYHGLADMIVSPRLSEAYVARLRKTMGGATIDAFLRFYEIPGFSHGFGSIFNASWDPLSALENWAEHGKDPGDGEIMTDTFVVPGRTRPLCRFPAFARYKGTGDINVASSFSCATDKR